MEQTLQRYKQKLDESADVRKRAKEADDARAEQAERALKAEEECAKLRHVEHNIQSAVNMSKSWVHFHHIEEFFDSSIIAIFFLNFNFKSFAKNLLS